MPLLHFYWLETSNGSTDRPWVSRGLQMPFPPRQSLASLHVLSVDGERMLRKPCVDCGLTTSNSCDDCQAAERFPNEIWADGQMSPSKLAIFVEDSTGVSRSQKGVMDLHTLENPM